MIRHAWFDLWLHSDDELSEKLGSSILERETLHEWPLSCVQRITTTDGKRWIYKTQNAPTVEAEFYAAAKSDLLVGSRLLERDPVVMLLDFIDAPTLSAANETEAIALTNRVLAGIQQIEGDTPIWLDISSAEKWSAAMFETRAILKSLVDSGGFTQVNEHAVHIFEHAISSTEMLAAAEINTGLVHGDLYQENIFLLPDGSLKVIDWSRPYRASAELDRMTLLESLGFKPPRDTFVTMAICLRIHWFAECASRWFPPGKESYDEQIATLIGNLSH